MQVWKTKIFQAWQKKAAITDKVLVTSVNEIRQGLFDADLGAGLIKKRVSRLGQGKRSGYRTLIATNFNEKWFFIYGFSKNEKDNIRLSELIALKRLAEELLSFTKNELDKAIKAGQIKEVFYEK